MVGSVVAGPAIGVAGGRCSGHRLRNIVSTVKKSQARDRVRLRRQELLPGRSTAARRRVNPRPVQDLPDRAGRDPVAETGQFSLHPAMPPGRVLRG